MAQKVPEKGQIKSIKPGSPEMEAFLATGYWQFDITTAEDAKAVIADWEKNHDLGRVSRDQLRAANAFLAALNTSPEVIDKDNPGLRNTRPR